MHVLAECPEICESPDLLHLQTCMAKCSMLIALKAAPKAALGKKSPYPVSSDDGWQGLPPDDLISEH